VRPPLHRPRPPRHSGASRTGGAASRLRSIGADAYLDLYGSDLATAWHRCCTAVNAFGEHADERQRQLTVAAAIATFDAYGAALDVVT
jgi:hypothetical protein